MSYVDSAKLKGTLNVDIPHITITVAFTTAVVTLDVLSQYGSYARAYKIVNNDATNVVNFVQHQLTDVQRQVPIQSEVSDEGWFSFIQITADAVTGTGYIELELVKKEDAEI